mgnify:CR=1 FL=1
MAVINYIKGQYRQIINLSGDKLGWPRCPISGESLYGGYTFVLYTPERGMRISRELAKLPPDELTQKVYDYITTTQTPKNEPVLNPDETSEETIKQRNKPENLITRIRIPSLFERYDPFAWDHFPDEGLLFR